MTEENEITGYEFGPFILEVATRRLRRDQQTVPLTVKLFDILSLLVRNHGQIVSKEKLFNEIWPDSFVEENNLTVAMSALRKTLGESRREHEYIETVPKRGYRFVAQVREIREGEFKPGNGQKPGVSATRWTETHGIITSLAVLPLINTGNDPDVDYLSDGITESIINTFSRLPQLRVMARSTVFRYKGKSIDPLEVGRSLQVQAVLTGTLVHLGDQIVIGIELVNTGDGAQLWGEQYKLTFSNLLEVQGRIVDEVSNNLRLRLSLEEKAILGAGYRVSPEAYRLYLKGRYFLSKRIEGNIQKGIDYFQKAINEDAGYAQAYAGIADCYSLLGSYGTMPERDALALASPLAERALTLSPNLAEAHASLGFIKAYSWEWPGAEKHFQRAIQLQPGYQQARHWYSLLLMWKGRFDESQKELEYNLSISPLSPHVNTSRGVFSYFTRRYDEAIAWCQEALELDPAFYPAYAALGLAYLQKGMSGEAIEALERVFRMSNEPEALSMLGYTLAKVGRKDEALEIIDRLDELSRQRYVKPYHFAIVYVALEETDLAFDWLEKAFADRNDLMVVIKIDPRLDELCNDPRLNSLVQRMAL